MNTITVTSVIKSESEGIPSAILAGLCPTIPSIILPIVNTKFINEPVRVTFLI